MVFTKLSVQEKEAFFGLLDEYFQSRPEIFNQSGPTISTAAATSVVQRALAANASSSGVTHKSNNPYTANMPNVDVTQAMKVGRVAAASLAFSGGGTAPSPAPPTHDAPSLPRRTTPNPLASAPSASASASASIPGLEVDKLVARKAGVFSAFGKAPQAGSAVTIPSAFSAPKGTFGPPPVRRVTSETPSTGSGAGAGAGATRQVPQVKRESEPEVQGEWAEVLYDYSSKDAGDLAIEAGARVLVTAKSSEDWWTGQVEGQGREGLFPASYVTLL